MLLKPPNCWVSRSLPPSFDYSFLFSLVSTQSSSSLVSTQSSSSLVSTQSSFPLVSPLRESSQCCLVPFLHWPHSFTQLCKACILNSHDRGVLCYSQPSPCSGAWVEFWRHCVATSISWVLRSHFFEIVPRWRNASASRNTLLSNLNCY